jgi:hypothetical protein
VVKRILGVSQDFDSPFLAFEFNSILRSAQLPGSMTQ